MPSFRAYPAGTATKHAKDRPWGFWATLGFSAAVGAAFVAVQVLAVFAVVAASGAGHSVLTGFETPSTRVNGFLLAVSTLVTTPVCVMLVVFFVWLRHGPGVGAYLCWRSVSWPTMGRWVLLGVGAAFAIDTLTSLVGRPQVPDFMIDAYLSSAGFAPLLWIAVVVAAPLFEELFFRGFVFEGLRYSRLGPIGAILVTALAWALLHLQYDAFDDAIVFVMGVLLGVARLRTGSTRATYALHALWNFIAMSEVALLLHGV